ncbi:MAG: hypothetical protein JW995_01850 [Melioribacteraceae bacterium]|nr:hypothetical protein [Melioribacteraceae bacterium]
MKESKKIFPAVLFLLYFTALISAQTSSEKYTSNKLKNLKGTVQEITIKTDQDEVTVTGSEAEQLFNRLKGSKMFFISSEGKGKEVVIISESGDSTKLCDVNEWEDIQGKTIKKIKRSSSDKKKAMEFLQDKDSLSESKRIEIEDNNGNKKVTITTRDESGNETTEILEGKEAEDKIKELKALERFNAEIDDGNIFIIKMDGNKKLNWIDDDDVMLFEGSDSDSASKIIRVIIDDEDSDMNIFMNKTGNDDFEWVLEDELKSGKKIKVEIENGVKKVWVTKIEDGKETTEMYEGKEAENYLENLKHSEDINVEVKEKQKQIIIKKMK